LLSYLHGDKQPHVKGWMRHFICLSVVSLRLA